MIATSRLTRKNQTTIPKAVVEALGMKPSDRLVYEIEDDRVVVTARTGSLVDMAGNPPLSRPKRARLVAEINDAAAAGYVAHARKDRPDTPSR